MQGRWHLLRRTGILFWDLCVNHVYPTTQALFTLHPVCNVRLISVYYFVLILLLSHYYHAAILMGHIMGLASPSVCLPVLHGS